MTPSVRSLSLRVLLGLAGGLLVGGLTLALQGILPGAWNQLANSGAVWCAGAFLGGALAWPRATTARAAAAPGATTRSSTGRVLAMLLGTAVLFGAVIGYYGSTTVFLHDDVSATALTGPVVWLIVACAAGPVFGLAGWAYRHGGTRATLIGMGALGAMFVAEGVYQLAALGYREDALIFAAIGVLVPVVLGRSGRERLRGLAALVPLIAAGCLAEGAVYLITRAAF